MHRADRNSYTDVWYVCLAIIHCIVPYSFHVALRTRLFAQLFRCFFVDGRNETALTICDSHLLWINLSRWITHVENFLFQSCNILSVSSIIKWNRNRRNYTMNLLLLDNFYPAASHRRVRKESGELSYWRLGRSLWSAIGGCQRQVVKIYTRRRRVAYPAVENRKFDSTGPCNLQFDDFYLTRPAAGFHLLCAWSTGSQHRSCQRSTKKNFPWISPSKINIRLPDWFIPLQNAYGLPTKTGVNLLSRVSGHHLFFYRDETRIPRNKTFVLSIEKGNSTNLAWIF